MYMTSKIKYISVCILASCDALNYLLVLASLAPLAKWYSQGISGYPWESEPQCLAPAQLGDHSSGKPEIT